MDRLAELSCLTLILCLLYGLSEAMIGSNYVVDVQFKCPPEPDGIVRVIVKTDIPKTHPYALCHGPFGFDFIPMSPGTWYLDIHFQSPDAREYCWFSQTGTQDEYLLNVYVPVSSGLVTSNDPAHRVVCNYQDDSETPPNLISNVVESKKPFESMISNMGPVSKSDVALSLTDITGTPVTGGLNVGRLVMLKAVLVGNYPAETSFHALTCKAVCNKKEYALLNAGCGDGTVIGQKKGFRTKGKVAFSPVFRLFRMELAKPLMFECTFIICQKCDGDSCEDQDRRKRHLSAFERNPELEKGKHIITARVEIPSFREHHLTTHEHSVIPVSAPSGLAVGGIRGSEAARDIHRSEAARNLHSSGATEDLVLTILVAVIIPLVFLVVIMLMFIIAISRALRSLAALYKDVNRLRGEVVAKDVKDVKVDIKATM
ncbi:vitelline envelope sperm lysin receptor-like [Haliotis rubra]|uniref:vitelline envelope sperm lysin receptor-like n=1 Tax=Haliotis rubra TaxID=36100 RepID=UPI001EE5CE6D|nr:vitelline envelope sperm lysin receptor-like [Haliotis rubra]